MTLLGAVVPGAGYVWAGRRLGYLLMGVTVAAEVLLLVYVSDLETLIALAVDPSRLMVLSVALVAGFAVWAFVVVTTYLMVRPVGMTRRRRVGGGVFVCALCVLVGVPVVQGVRYAATQADLVNSVFTGNRTATAPQDVSEVDPWGGRKHVGVLVLGADSGPNRYGTRTDTVALLDVDTRTGESVLFSLPRNMMNAQFPGDSPLHDVFPDGFRGDGDPAGWMLNAVYGQVPTLHPGILGGSDNEGADALKQAVQGSLGTRVDYYVMVDLQGFPKIVDAMGGVTVNVNQPVAIGGDTDRGIPPRRLPPARPRPAPRRLPRAVVRARPVRLRRLPADAPAALHDRRPDRGGAAAQPAAPLRGPRRRREGDPAHRHPAGAAAGVRRPRARR